MQKILHFLFFFFEICFRIGTVVYFVIRMLSGRFIRRAEWIRKEYRIRI